MQSNTRCGGFHVGPKIEGGTICLGHDNSLERSVFQLLHGNVPFLFIAL
jgi:hypothetical protein